MISRQVARVVRKGATQSSLQVALIGNRVRRARSIPQLLDPGTQGGSPQTVTVTVCGTSRMSARCYTLIRRHLRSEYTRQCNRTILRVTKHSATANRSLDFWWKKPVVRDHALKLLNLYSLPPLRGVCASIALVHLSV